MALEPNGMILEEKPLLDDISADGALGGNGKNEENMADESQSTIRKMDVGVWRLFYLSSTWEFMPGAETLRKLREIGKNMSYVGRFLKDLWGIAPRYLVLWFFLELWSSMQNAASLWVKARMLQTVRNTLRSSPWYSFRCSDSSKISYHRRRLTQTHCG
jgi:hypothetical protein